MDIRQENSRVATVIDVADKIHENVAKLTTILRKKSYSSEEAKLAEATDRLLADLVGALSDLREPVPVESVTETPDRYSREGRDREETHESFGVLQFNRVSGGRKLFGSAIHHQHYITLKILRASARYRSLDSEMSVWPGNDADSHIVECILSAAQFAEAITAMNIGFGVPCTLTDVRGRTMAPVPDTHTNSASRVVEEFQRGMEDTETVSESAYTDLVKEIEASSLSKKAQAALIAKARGLKSRHAERAEFVLDQFNKSAEKRLSQVKTELDATLSLFTQNLGMNQLQALREQDLVPVIAADNE